MFASRRWLSSAAAASAIGLFATSAGAQVRAVGAPEGDERASVERLLEARSGPPIREAAGELAKLGRPALAQALDFLLDPRHASRELRGVRVALAAIACDPSLAREWVVANADAKSVEPRRVALNLLAEFGVANDVSLAVRAARERDDDAATALTDEFDASVHAIFERDPRAVAEAARVLRSTGETLAPRLMHDLGDRPAIESAKWLANIASVRDVWRANALAELGRVIARDEPAPDETVSTVVRAALDDLDRDVRRQAVLDCGRLEDARAAPTLVDLLADDGAAVRDEALWSLQRISGLHMGLEVDRWKAWLAREELWWSERAHATVVALDSRAPRAVADALNELAAHRLHRHELAPEIAKRLSSFDAATIGIAVAALQTLHSRASLPYLLEGLNDAAPRVQAAAAAVMRELAGKNVAGGATASSPVER